MNIALKPDLENYVNEQVRVGRYRSADEFLAAAIARMMQDERVERFAPGELDKLLAEGDADLACGDSVTLDEAREHFRRRAAGSQPAQD